MRLASLALERYGRFQDCEMHFRPGQPDLHVIYGPNEAGKTTSLAAVSDLLFGFQTRSAYNFLFHYSLLHIGATLEDDGRVLACRRKKGTAGTLIDAGERPIDEGALLAMLRGQTRETFGLSFSLNQEGLRAGGRAIVEARNDVGRALFAAGSGLTGVSDELALIESEADAIWGPRAAARRSFTQAQRELADSVRLARDHTLRPKNWLDAKAAAGGAQAALEEAQRRRDEVMTEVRRAERIRRIAPTARLRADRIAALSGHGDTVDIAPHRAAVAEAAMADAEMAVRDRAAAEQLVREANGRIAALAADPGILSRADEIDDLVTSSGAIDKASRDLDRLTTDLKVGAALVARLRDEVGGGNVVPPTRIASARLREMANSQAGDASALKEIGESEKALIARREALAVRIGRLSEASGLQRIVDAVEAARALGADVDARCAATRRKAERAIAARDQALSRLAPWTGNIESLLAMTRIPQSEIDDVRIALGDLTAEVARERATAARARDEAAAASLQMEQLASGVAVSPEEIATARTARAERWRPLREHLRSGVPVVAVEVDVASFEAAVAQADERSDLRFAAADDSSRLTLLDQRRATLTLEAVQAEARASAASERLKMLRAEWASRLSAAGHPDLEPGHLTAWSNERSTAEGAQVEVEATAAEADTARSLRHVARSALVNALGSAEGAPVGDELAPLLAYAERIRKDGEEREQQRRLDVAALGQIEADLGDLAHRRRRLEQAIEDRAADWSAALVQAGLVLDVSAAGAILDVLDELRTALGAQDELRTRMEGIVRDAAAHGARVGTMADVLGIHGPDDAAGKLRLLRTRLATARSVDDVMGTLLETADSRAAEVAEAEARIAAARTTITPLLQDTGSLDEAGLAAAIARSREARTLRDSIVAADATILAEGDGYSLEELLGEVDGVDTDGLAARSDTLATILADLNEKVASAATAQGDAQRAFADLERQSESAVDAATDAEQARAELGVLAEQYILKRAQAVTLRWAIERYRERHQDPMLIRASEIFSTLTIGRYAALRIDTDGPVPRLLGLRDDGRTVVEIGAMSEGTTDQLFLALRLAAIEQSVAAGVRLPFLADDLFVNFDDQRSEAGFKVLSELARSTQVLFFTHHPHLAEIARSVVGAERLSECSLV